MYVERGDRNGAEFYFVIMAVCRQIEIQSLADTTAKKMA